MFNLSNKSFNIIISFFLAYFFIFISETPFYTKLLQFYNIEHLIPTFIDFRSYQALTSTVDSGLNPYLEHPFDPKGRPFNLPFIWYYISKYINLSSEVIFKITIFGFISLYIGSVLNLISLIKELRLRVIIYLLLFSSSSMLVIERGNTDMLIFGLVSFSAYNSNFLRSVFLIFVASILKLYPLFSFILNFYSKKNFFISLTLIIIALSTFFKELKYLLFNTHSTYDTSISFGINSIAKGTIKGLDRLEIGILNFPNLNNYYYIYFFIVLILLTYLIILFKNKLIDIDKDFLKIENRLFLTGSSIYCGSFLFFSSYDYRLIFLFLTIPYFFKIKNLISTIYIISLFISMNSILLFSIADSPLNYAFVGLFIHFFKFLIFLILLNELMKFFITFLKAIKK